jgi:hypothetical protein
MSLVVGELTACAIDISKIGGPEAYTSPNIHQLALITGFWTLRSKIAQPNDLIGNYEILETT